MKSCLKLSSLPPTPDLDCCPRKCVAFCAEGSEQVFPADDWDRTPAEPAQKLTYSDILELKEIQRSLPTASQMPDPLCQRPQTQILKKVPIGLLPLLPETYSCGDKSPTPISSTPTTPPATTTSFPMTFKARPQLTPWRPPPNPQPRTSKNSRTQPHMSFLPLLDTPSSVNPSPADSPPSSPRTFAEFEASLELGNDKYLHHVPPTPTLADSPLNNLASHQPNPSLDPVDPFRLPARAISPPAQSLPTTKAGGSYFPPFSEPPTHPNSGYDEGSIQGRQLEAKSSEVPQGVPAPPPPLSVTSSGTEPQPVKTFQTYTQLHGSTQGRTSYRPSLALGEVDEGKVTNVIGRNSSPQSPGPKSPPPLAPKQAFSPPPIPVTRTASPPGRTLQPRWKPGSEAIAPFFAFEFTASNISRPTSPPKRMTSPTRSRDLQPPSPILAPYCAPMRSRGSPCLSPIIPPLNKGRRAGVGT